MEILGRLQQGSIRIGTKQTTKLVELGEAAGVYVAQDADTRLISRITQLCIQHGVPVTQVNTMRELGKACGIDVGTAMVAIVEE